MKKREFFLATILIFVALGFLIPRMGEFIYPLGSKYSDVVISHYPNFIFLRSSILNHQQIPLWSNTILSGYPLAANPLAGMWYLPTWLAVLIPAPFGINLLVLLHLIFGGAGMYLFLKNQGLAFWASTIGALSYTLMPKLFAHYAAGHITLVFAVCWTPWLLVADQNRRNNVGRLQRVLPGIILGEIFLADPRWVVYAGGLWFLLVVKTHIKNGNKFWKKTDFSLTNFRSNKSQIFWVWDTGIQAMAAMLIAAPLLFPLIQYSSLSTRSLMVPMDNLILSLDFIRLIGLAIPDLAGYAEYMIYPGSILLVALLWTLFHREARRENWFWLLIFLLAVFYALGENLPGMTIITRLPGMSLLRVPSRALFLAGFALSVMCAKTIQFVSSQGISNKYLNESGTVFLVGFAGFLIMITVGISILSASVPVEFFWGAAAVLFAVILLVMFEKRKITPFFALCGVVSVMCLDLGGVAVSQIAYHAKSEVVEDKTGLINYFTKETELFRIYSPSYSVPQQMAALNGLELADGIDPLQLISYVEFMSAATGISNISYSVTLPPFSSGDPGRDNQSVQPDIELLSLLNVKFIAAEFPVSNDGLQLVDRYGETWLYENMSVLPRAWVQAKNSQKLGQNIRPVKFIERTPNQITITAEGPGLLVLSEVNYPGWKVRIDGQLSDLEAPSGFLRTVLLDSGFHTVIFEFKPFWVYLGVVLKLLALSVFFILVWSDLRAT